jgi:hypothetical protein
MPPTRIYADTSVYGGCFDPEFKAASLLFFDQVRQGRFTLAISALLTAEIEPAPAPVRELYQSLAPFSSPALLTGEALDLRDAYLAAGIVSERSEDDALHVALATTSGCRILVSWNYKHIVHVDKAPRYNAVNTLRGLPPVDIHAPPEVIRYEERL